MEIYKEITSPASKEFEKLLNNQLSKNIIEEGKIIEGKIAKISDKFVFLYVDGAKQEPVIDINELKTLKIHENIKVGDKISVLLERLEDKNGEMVVSATKAQKIKGWYELEKAYEKNEPIMGRIKSKCKGGVVVEHVDTGSLMFCPGSQISDKPIKDISHLMNEPQKFALIKLDKIRGNACVSRRQIISSNKKEDKAKIVGRYKVGDVIKNAIVKGYSSFGCFFEVNSELDVLVHLMEVSWSRINHPDEVFTIGERHDLKVIDVNLDKLQVGCSIKQLTRDPFENISNYELNKPYRVKVIKLMEFGAFCELEPGLSTLLHASEISWHSKNPSIKKMLKVGSEIMCCITDINLEKRRVAISHKLTLENPYVTFEKKYKIGSEIGGVISGLSDFAIYLKLDKFEIDAFLHCNSLSYNNDGEEQLKKYKIGDRLDKVKILEIKKDEQKVRVGLRETKPDSFVTFFKNKKEKDIITVKVISTDSKSLTVRPENSELTQNFIIKKSQISINVADARPSRWNISDRLDVCIAGLNLEKRQANLSIKLLEELQNKAALEMGKNPLSGRQLPFKSLSDKLEKKKKK